MIFDVYLAGAWDTAQRRDQMRTQVEGYLATAPVVGVPIIDTNFIRSYVTGQMMFNALVVRAKLLTALDQQAFYAQVLGALRASAPRDGSYMHLHPCTDDEGVPCPRPSVQTRLNAGVWEQQELLPDLAEYSPWLPLPLP